MSDSDGLGRIASEVSALRQRFALRDARAADVRAVRNGDFDQVAYGLFSEDWPRPTVANLIDVMARDFASTLAPLPSFSCSSVSMKSDAAKKAADLRTKIVANYIAHSHLGAQMQSGADGFNCYGLAVACIEPDFEARLPRIVVEDAIGTYPVWDRAMRTVKVARVFRRDMASLQAAFPDVNWAGLKVKHQAGDQVEIIKFVDARRVVVYVPELGNLSLVDVPNPIGECYYVCVPRPTAGESFSGEIRGAYDDLIWPQMARHNFQMLAMNAADQAVNAPIAVPTDVGDVPYGPGAVIRTQNPQGVQRVKLDVPQQSFQAMEWLRQDMQLGGMSPEARTGNIDASVITGQGVQQLSAGYSTQVAAAQEMLVFFYGEIVRKCFKMDEALWPNLKKTVRGHTAGQPFEIRYTPSKDIDGDHSVDVQYGFMAGMDQNRALVYILQAQAAGLVSRDYARRALPSRIDAADEESKIQVEQMRESMVQAVAGYAQSIAALAANGQDPAPAVLRVAEITDGLQKGKPMEDVIRAVFAPPPPPPAASSPEDPLSQGAGSDSAAGGPGGMSNGGLPAGLQPGLATEGPNGRPDLQQFFAGLSSSGSPVLQGGVSRMNPAG